MELSGSRSGRRLVDDDVAVKDSTYTVGRRGVAGNFFVIKAVGAGVEQGAGLDELLRIGNKVNSVTRTMGMALTSCTPPAKEASPLFDLGHDEMENGCGHHGEGGTSSGEGGERQRDRRTNCSRWSVTDLPFAGATTWRSRSTGARRHSCISESFYLLYG